MAATPAFDPALPILSILPVPVLDNFAPIRLNPENENKLIILLLIFILNSLSIE